ncbi:hypothetical protein ACG83_39435 [Frankia sp. R43]|uniref:alpha/beta hydrolase family protein n=1 Tax=Frankia sp. R43 TaxID=269536 RepID=UPI0006CA0917|nr:alpha/beta hydrolase [Frankia sp. R43]KPM50613.1 hypothetical protein ACG83_39435 [Frankia sp. R43]
MTTAWDSLLTSAFDDPAGRLTEVSVEERELDGGPIGLVRLRFTAEDLRGETYEARAKLFLPADPMTGQGDRLPVWFNCGYELTDALASERVRRGWIVVTPCDPEEDEVFPFHNPLCRGPNTDYVLAHMVRALQFVDPAAIVYSGGSAGGYAALLVAAEAFPAGAVAANAPVVNLAYEGAYMMDNCPRIAAEPPAEHPFMGVLMGVFLPFIDKGWRRTYGMDVGAPAWWQHSPVAHVDRITCPVAATFSTADFLVPLEQVGTAFADEGTAHAPKGVVRAPADLTDASGAAVRLLDVLGDSADVRILPVPAGATELDLADIDFTMSRPQAAIPVPSRTADAEQWLIVVVDEGPPVMGMGHTRHGMQPDFDPFAQEALAAGPTVDQLTTDKLEQLLARWSGQEWLAPGFHHLDRAGAERADVERGLRLYCGISPGHARRFEQLYLDLDETRRLLPEALVSDLTGPAGDVLVRRP